MQHLEVSGAVRYIYIYIYICVCVCVCVFRRLKVNHALFRVSRPVQTVHPLYLVTLETWQPR